MSPKKKSNGTIIVMAKFSSGPSSLEEEICSVFSLCFIINDHLSSNEEKDIRRVFERVSEMEREREERKERTGGMCSFMLSHQMDVKTEQSVLEDGCLNKRK